MKTKHYEFTEDELMVLTNAMIEYNQFVRGLNPRSPIAIRNKKIAKVLSDQFKTDYANI